MSKEIILAAQNGCEIAFSQLFEKYNTFLINVARKFRRDCPVEDAVQDVWVIILRKLGELKDPEVFMGWAATITRRHILNLYKRSKLFTDTDDFPEKIAPEEKYDLEYRETLEYTRKSLDNVREMDKTILTLFYLEEMGLAEISDKLEIPMGTSKRRLHVARKRLRKFAEESNYFDILT